MTSWTKLLFTTYPFTEGLIYGDLRLFDKDDIVILVQGLNINGQRIYAYLRVDSADLYFEVMMKLERKDKFDLREYGEIIAAGLGDPRFEEKIKLDRLYDMLPYEKKSSK